MKPTTEKFLRGKKAHLIAFLWKFKEVYAKWKVKPSLKLRGNLLKMRIKIREELGLWPDILEELDAEFELGLEDEEVGPTLHNVRHKL